jgi:hypothetical protein
VEAAPQAGGTFSVTSSGDANASDLALTLREALLVAAGGTGAAGLNRGASVAEQSALNGCTFDGGGLVTGGCGTGIADTVVFSTGLGVNPIITLTAALPTLNDSASTIVDGAVGAVYPIIAATLLPGSTDAWQVTSNDNTIKGLTIRGAPRDDLHVQGSRNQVVTGTVLLGAGRYGVYVEGGQVISLTGALVGVPNAAGGCGQGNAQGGIVLANNTVSSTIYGVTVACNSGVGIRVDGSDYNIIEVSNILSQTGNGVELLNGANVDRVYGATILGNSLNGVYIAGATTSSNSVAGLCTTSQIGCQSTITPTVVAGNGLAGVRLEADAHDNTISGSFIGLARDGLTALGNGGPGLVFDTAPNNRTGLAGLGYSSQIAGNAGPGILITNTTGIQVGWFTSVGTTNFGNGGAGIEVVNSHDTSLTPFVVQHNAGAGIAVVGAASNHNLIAPVIVSSNGGLPIDLGNDGHTPNGAHNLPGPNDWLPYPTLTDAAGSVITGTACANCSVYIYTALGNPGAPGGGGQLPQIAQANALGQWSATLTVVPGPGEVTLVACEGNCPANVFSLIDPLFVNTSEMSPRLRLWQPFTWR